MKRQRAPHHAPMIKNNATLVVGLDIYRQTVRISVLELRLVATMVVVVVVAMAI